MNISSYLTDLASRFGGPHAIPTDAVERKVTFMDIQLIKPPGEGVYILVGYVDGCQLYHGSEELFAIRNHEAVACMCLLPVRTGVGPRNLAVVYKSSPTVVRFVDMTSGETYHMVRLTSTIVGMKSNRVCLAVQMEGKVGFYDIDTLQDTFSVEVTPNSPALALGDRWVAYNLRPQISSPSTSSSKPVPGLWSTITSLGQDAIDNIVLAVYKRDTEAMVTSPKESVSSSGAKHARNGIVAIKDVVTQRVMGCVEDRESNRAVEWLEWSVCGTLLVTSICNGHWCKVYRATKGLEFQLAFSLNRGMTPAVITSISVNFGMDTIAVCSAKGTVHLFSDLDQGVVTASDRIRAGGGPFDVTPVAVTESPPKVLFDPAGDLLVVNRNILTTYKGVVPTGVLALNRAANDPSRENVFLTLSEAIVAATRGPTLVTCRPVPVLPWKSPLIEWTSLDDAENHHPPTIAIQHENLWAALNTELSTGHSPTEQPYIPSTKDGFVQVV